MSPDPNSTGPRTPVPGIHHPARATSTFGPNGSAEPSGTTGAAGTVSAPPLSPSPDDSTRLSADPPAAPHFVPPIGAGTIIAGRYTLLKKIGEGGMGAVFRASQTEPVKREVALKLIKTGMDSRAVLARFEAERQALALMDHPNIARIFDGGLTPTGQPFFVMELVDGPPITEFCDAHRLTIDARLRLFVAVCQAVQHAHQKGIIHRDLKPGNVLVADVDGYPTPKVIDFGVAKATEQRLTDLSLAETGAIVGTPAYMSPEQADPTALGIDTRTDVYALGVILYELLVGSQPLAAAQFHRGALLEMLRMVREVNPPRPSTRLSTADGLPNIAAARNTEPAKLAKLLRGELDWVVLKALEKDRDRRYESATAFARDVERYLADEVVEARPPSTGYRARKFVARNRVSVGAAGAVLLALVAGVIGTTLGLIHAGEKQREAERARSDEAEQRQVAEAKEREAREERAKAVANEKLATERLEESENALDKLAEAYRTGGRLVDAIQLYQQLEQSRAKRLGVSASRTLTTMNNLALAYEEMGRLVEASVLLEKVRLGFVNRRGNLHPDTLITSRNLARVYLALGRVVDAILLLERTRGEFVQTVGEDHPETLMCCVQLAQAYQMTGQVAKADEVFKFALHGHQKILGPDHPRTINTYSDLARINIDTGRLHEAIVMLRDGLARSRRVLGPDHETTVKLAINLAFALRISKQFVEATAELEQVRDAHTRRLSTDYPQYRTVGFNLAIVYHEQRKTEQALTEVAEMMKLSGWNAGQWYIFACVYSVASAKFADKQSEYAARAVELLAKAVKAGWKDAAHLKMHTDLDPLRDRADFRAIVADLERRFPPPLPVAPPPREKW